MQKLRRLPAHSVEEIFKCCPLNEVYLPLTSILEIESRLFIDDTVFWGNAIEPYFPVAQFYML